jgi:hypothetical protein
MVVDHDGAGVFNILVAIRIEAEGKTLFWRDIWIWGLAITDIAPLVCDLINTTCPNRRIVHEAKLIHRCISDVRGNLSPWEWL